jgi:hypothetical protein
MSTSFFNAEGIHFFTPKAFANFSPGLERSYNPGLDHLMFSTLKGFAFKPNAFSVFTFCIFNSQGSRHA